ncbi:hypothetical protein F2P81_022475 [Scophthalmus maximus]|uniref:Uncharacterized protein n=1 Tax=Scophthalmus maximus TaxID=52904 RepID=A0A6A4S502_SCOMX|nr:hypothetical protein F2P81_022475 [Scophthalmus maximus]
MTLEKPSIGALLDDITDRINRQHDTVGIYFTVSETCVEIADQIAQSDNPMPCLEAPSVEELEEGIQRQRIRNVVAARKYEKLVNDLLDCLEDTDLEMMIHAASEKPKDDLLYEEMSEGEKIIFEYFSDPEFIDQLIEFLSLEDRKGKDSFNPRRFCLFKGGLAQQQWRVSELLHRLLTYLEPKLTQVYKNVRERIGSVLTYIFMIDVALPHTRSTRSPHVAEFVTRVLERLKPLTSEPEIHNHVHEENTQETDERTQAVKLLKTGLFMHLFEAKTLCMAKGQQTNIAPVEIDESYDEMKQDARTCLSLMSQGLLYPEHIPLMAGNRSWHARFSVLTYLQIMVFYNLFTLLSVNAEVLRIRKLVMQLLLDEQLEMTVKKTLSEFRRTHHDNWQEHRQSFTDDQLLVLTDLLVSPCYYA